MSPAKVMLSPKEQELVTDAGWILTKNNIINKVYELFGGLSEQYQLLWDLHKDQLLLDQEFRTPKISKGEQYEGLPWVNLDHPRYFSAEDCFAIRSFFWWGNFCSISLQLSGKYQLQYANRIHQYLQSKKCEILSKDEWSICINQDPWQHHFRKDNYMPYSQIGSLEIADLPFLKMAKKIPLTDWEQLPSFFEKNYQEIVEMLSAIN